MSIYSKKVSWPKSRPLILSKEHIPFLSGIFGVEDLMLDTIRDFLSQQRLAIVGVSHQPKDFSRALFRAFQERNFNVVPVNPSAQEIEGVVCYSHVRDIRPPVDTALLMTSPAVTDEVVKDCADAGIRRVWM